LQAVERRTKAAIWAEIGQVVDFDIFQWLVARIWNDCELMGAKPLFSVT
jgi:hypothetical protein